MNVISVIFLLCVGIGLCAPPYTNKRAAHNEAYLLALDSHLDGGVRIMNQQHHILHPEKVHAAIIQDQHDTKYYKETKEKKVTYEEQQNIVNDAECEACKVIATLIRELLEMNKSKDELLKAVETLCIDLKIEDARVCKGIVKMFQVSSFLRCYIIFPVASIWLCLMIIMFNSLSCQCH